MNPALGNTKCGRNLLEMFIASKPVNRDVSKSKLDLHMLRISFRFVNRKLVL